MKIKKLKLRNFRQFMEIDIDFSTDKNKNVTVIIAENSTGKTTLMQSIKWCLYGDDETDLDNKNRLLNQYVQETSNLEKENLSVQVVIEEEGIDYTITREREVFRKSDRVSKERISVEFKSNDGETHIITSLVGDSSNEIKKINRMINQILTREMSKYFLFDGERIDNLGNNNAKSKRDIRQAIGAINGFSILDNSLRSLNNMKKLYKSKLTEGVNDKEVQQIHRQINNLERTIVEVKNEIDELEKEISENDNHIKRLDNELSMHDKVHEYTQKRRELEIKISKDEVALDKLGKDIISNSYRYRIKTLIGLMQEKYAAIKFNEELEKKTISNMQASAIDEIIERGTCICGEPLTEGHLGHLLEQRNYQPPISNAQLVLGFKSTVRDELTGMNNDYIHLERIKDNYIEIIDNMAVNQEELTKLSNLIGNNDSDEIKVKNAKRDEIKKRSKDIKNRKIRLEIQLETEEKELIKNDKKYNELINTMNKNNINKIRYDLVNDSIMILEDRNNKDRAARKKQIEEKANEHFSDIIYKKKNITLNDNFEYTVTELNGQVASPSEGERNSISMSLILAIIDSHKEIVNSKSKDQDYNYINEKEFTIILDAAFAKLDNQFSRRISEKLPKSVEQVILFSTLRQYDGPVEQSLAPYIGRKYLLSIPDSERENALTNEEISEI